MDNVKQRSGMVSCIRHLDAAIKIPSVDKDVEHFELLQLVGI